MTPIEKWPVFRRHDHAAIAAAERREADQRAGEEPRPPTPDWIIELGIGQCAPPSEVHVGYCHAAGKPARHRPRPGACPARRRYLRLRALPARHRPRGFSDTVRRSTAFAPPLSFLWPLRGGPSSVASPRGLWRARHHPRQPARATPALRRGNHSTEGDLRLAVLDWRPRDCRYVETRTTSRGQRRGTSDAKDL